MFSRTAVFALFYLSGIAGLIYQVLWLRRLSVIFGVTVYAASTVLAAFMAGLAIGSALSGRVLRPRHRAACRVRHRRNPDRRHRTAFAACCSTRRRRSTACCTTSRPESLGVLTIARLVCSLAILALPTTMMGITLPLLTAAVTRQTGIGGHERQPALRAQHARRDDGHAAGRIHPDSSDRHQGGVSARGDAECAGRSRRAVC